MTSLESFIYKMHIYPYINIYFNFQVYTNVGAEKGYNLNIRQNDGGNIYTRNNGYTEYETKEKVRIKS